MDWSLVEAARDLGATPLKAFLTVTLKLTLPGLLSGVILTFIPSMGLFFIADILGGNKVVLVGSLIQDQLMKAHNWPLCGRAERGADDPDQPDDLAVQACDTPRNWRASYEKPYKTAQHLYRRCHGRSVSAHRARYHLFVQRKQDQLGVGRLFSQMVRNAVQGRRHVRGAGQQHRSGAVRQPRRGGHRHAGCLRLHQGAASHQKCRGICVHASHHDPRDHPWAWCS